MGDYIFNKNGGSEQSYGVVSNADTEELLKIVQTAKEDGIELVAIVDAECDVVMITSEKIANLLLPVLNSNNEPLEPLGRV